MKCIDVEVLKKWSENSSHSYVCLFSSKPKWAAAEVTVKEDGLVENIELENEDDETLDADHEPRQFQSEANGTVQTDAVAEVVDSSAAPSVDDDFVKRARSSLAVANESKIRFHLSSGKGARTPNRNVLKSQLRIQSRIYLEQHRRKILSYLAWTRECENANLLFPKGSFFFLFTASLKSGILCTELYDKGSSL